MRAQCPECDAWIKIPGSTELWDVLLCPNCDADLQLINVDPPELDYAGYDDDYDDDD